MMKEQVRMLREEIDDTTMPGSVHPTALMADSPAPHSHEYTENGQVASRIPGDINSHCNSCSSGPPCSPLNISSSTHRPHAEVQYIPVQPFPLFSRPECLALNYLTNRLQAVVVFPQDSDT